MNAQVARLFHRLAVPVLLAGLAGLVPGCIATEAPPGDESGLAAAEGQAESSSASSDDQNGQPAPAVATDTTGVGTPQSGVRPAHGAGNAAQNVSGKPASPNNPQAEPQPSPWMQVPTTLVIQDTPLSGP